ncbi:MAG: hypothetical protein JOY97_09850 [Hyphomicrobiales bacterium]|nr:hypothetical protein [Hyphomicrobiales bacterium]
MRSSEIHRRALALILAATGMSIAAATPASAQILSDTPFKGALTTLGIIAPERDPIEYHERAPLVVPKTMELPSPVQASAERNPDWPTDPDVAAKLKEKAENSKPVVRRQGGDNGGEETRLSVWEVLAGKSSSPPVQPAGPPGAYYDTNRVNENGFIPNSVVRAQGQQFASQDPEAQDQIRPGYEPKRRYLTDPPNGYRKPSDKAAFKKQYGAPVRTDKASESGDPLAFVKEQSQRQKGSYENDKDQ